MRTLLAVAVTIVSVATSVAVQADGDAELGRKKAFTCMGCHAAQGMRNAYPAYPVPKLGGQNAQYLVDALKGYKSGQRQHSTMRAHAATMSEQDMESIGAYFSSLTKP